MSISSAAAQNLSSSEIGRLDLVGAAAELDATMDKHPGTPTEVIAGSRAIGRPAA